MAKYRYTFYFKNSIQVLDSDEQYIATVDPSGKLFILLSDAESTPTIRFATPVAEFVSYEAETVEN